MFKLMMIDMVFRMMLVVVVVVVVIFMAFIFGHFEMVTSLYPFKSDSFRLSWDGCCTFKLA